MGLLSWPVIRSIPCPLANLGLKQTFPRQRGLILLLSVRRCCRLSDDNNSRSQRVIGLCALLLLYLAEGNAKGDSGGRHEWKTPGGMQYTHACTSNTAASTSLIFLYSSTFLRTRRHKHPSYLVWMTCQSCVTGRQSCFVAIIEMKNQQITDDYSDELFGCPLVAQRLLMWAALSWKSSFLSKRASSVTNRRPPLTKWEPARQMSLASLTLSNSPFTSTS